jgi:hypothetical protein
MKRQGLIAVLVSGSLWVLAAHAQTTITNVSQFSSAFDQPGLMYPLVSPCEPATFQPIDTWILDFTALTNAVGAITNYPGQVGGFTSWPLRLIQAADTGEVVLKFAGTADVELLRIPASANFVPFQGYKAALWSFCVLWWDPAYSGDLIRQCFPYMDPPNHEALIADGLTFLDPPRVVMDVWAVSAADEGLYSTNEAMAAPEAESNRCGGMMLMGMMLMAADPCAIVHDSDPFFVTNIKPNVDGNMVIEWQSCSGYRYEVQAAPALSTEQTMPAFEWSTLATVCGDDGTTSYTDEDSWLFDQRFYRVRRLASTPPTISCPADVAVECGHSQRNLRYRCDGDVHRRRLGRLSADHHPYLGSHGWPGRFLHLRPDHRRRGHDGSNHQRGSEGRQLGRQSSLSAD